jgi:hypothetical protein
VGVADRPNDGRIKAARCAAIGRSKMARVTGTSRNVHDRATACTLAQGLGHAHDNAPRATADHDSRGRFPHSDRPHPLARRSARPAIHRAGLGRGREGRRVGTLIQTTSANQLLWAGPCCKPRGDAPPYRSVARRRDQDTRCSAWDKARAAWRASGLSTTGRCHQGWCGWPDVRR